MSYWQGVIFIADSNKKFPIYDFAMLWELATFENDISSI